jgi:lysophospholipase L1-like esterase
MSFCGLYGDLARLPRYNLARARAIVFEIGFNNWKRDRFDHFAQKYAALLKAAPAGTPVIAVAIAPAGADMAPTDGIKQANRDIAAACAALPNCRYLDFSGRLADRGGHLAARFDVGDGVHHTSDAYAIWSAEFEKALP